MASVETYSVSGYGEMISDRVRMGAYTEALRRSVRSDTVVLDIGTGTGIFALLACHYGARKVYAVEPSECIQVARELAAANGLSDRIEFFNDLSTQIELPERADVIISDLRSILPLHQTHIPTIVDARQRLLKAGGVLIPQRDILWAALVSGTELYDKVVDPYLKNPYGFNLQAATRQITNEWRKGSKLEPADLFLAPQQWTILDYTQCESPDVEGNMTWQVDRAGTVSGICVWFDASLAEGVEFSNAPGKRLLIYGRAFFPWTHPVELAVGDTVSVTLQAKLVGQEYVWCWNTQVSSERRAKKPKAEFRQSTFYRTPLSAAQLRKRTDQYLPTLNASGQIRCFILQAMDARTPLGEVARQVVARFPNRFADWRQAFHEVAEVSQQYSD